MSEAPLTPSGGVPLEGDEDHLWISDYRQIARYRAASRSWDVFDLPWPLERNSGMIVAPVAGTLWGVALVCPEACDRVRPDGSPPVQVQAFRLDEGGLSVVGEPTGTLEDWGDFFLVGVDRESMTVAVRQGPAGGMLLTLDERSLRAEEFAPDLSALCTVDGGFVGVETVASDEAGAVPWAPLPPEWEPDPRDAKRVVAGPSIDEMGPVPLPDKAIPVLADWVGQATMCIPGGLALIGETSAWEYVDGTWSSEKSTLAEGAISEHAGVGRQLGDGSLYGPIPSGALMRNASGSWSLLPADPVYVSLGEQTLTYTRPEVPPLEVQPENRPGDGN